MQYSFVNCFPSLQRRFSQNNVQTLAASSLVSFTVRKELPMNDESTNLHDAKKTTNLHDASSPSFIHHILNPHRFSFSKKKILTVCFIKCDVLKNKITVCAFYFAILKSCLSTTKVIIHLKTADTLNILNQKAASMFVTLINTWTIHV